MHIQSIGCLYWQKRKSHIPCPIMKMGVNRASTIFGLSSWVIKARCVGHCEYTLFWQVVSAEMVMNFSLHHCKWNKLLQSGRLSREHRLLSCLVRLPIPPESRFAIMRHLDYTRCETWNRWRSSDPHFQDGARSVSLLLLPIKVANISVMTICNKCPLRLPRMQDLKSLTLHWRSFPGWGREHFSTFFDHKGGQYIQKEQRWTIANILRLTVGYLNVTINRTTRNAKPEIGPDGSSQTQGNPRVNRYGAGFGLPRRNWSGFLMGLELNGTVFPVQTRTAGGLPGPVANTRSNCRIWISFVNLVLWFHDCLVSAIWLRRFHQWLYWSIQKPPTLLICLTLQCAVLPASVSPRSWSHVLMDGKELDDKWYIWCQGCQSPQFCSANRRATKALV